MAEVYTEYVGSFEDPKSFTTRWWTADKKEQHTHIFQTVKMLETRQNYRTLANIRHARLYANLEVLGVYAGIYTAPVNDYVLPNRLSLNVIKSCIDTAAARIAKNKTRPLFLTEGGDYNLQKKAKQLTKFIDGGFDDMGLYEHKQMTFTDSGVFGTGALKFYKDVKAGKVACERAIIEELLVDDADALYGKPSVLYQRRLVNKDVLKELFPKFKDKIEYASNGIAQAYNSDMVKNLVKVVEAWHLPSAHGSDDGYHTICIDNATLLVEPYEYDCFPFVFERWTPRLVGFFGMGIAEELIGLQMAINRTLRDIQESMRLFAVPRVFVANNSQVNLNGINNDIASIIKYSGTQPPIFHTPQAMAPDVYQHLWMLYSKAFEIVGVSQMSATAQKPAGLNSGVALREYNDTTSERFQIVEQRREQSFLEAARLYIQMTKDLARDGVKVQVKVSDQGSMQTIRFNDIDLDADAYLLRAFPTSILPTQPAAKLQKVVELMQAGIFDKDTGFDLLDFPDLEATTSRLLSPRKIVLHMLDRIVDSGVYEVPEPYMNLSLAQSLSQQYYLDAKNRGVPEDRLELIRRYIDDARLQIEMATSAQAPMIAQADPAARAQQAPVSDMIPYATDAQGTVATGGV